MSPREVVIEAGPGAEITVANQDFSRAERSLSRLRVPLAPDIYALTVQVGGSIERRDLVLTRDGATVLPAKGVSVTVVDGTVRIVLDPPEFLSVAPLRATSRSADDHAEFVANCTDTSDAKHGHGGSAMIVARSWRRDARQRVIDPAEGISLHEQAGTQLAALKDGKRSPGDTPVTALTMDLTPGWYRLRMQRVGMPTVEQAVVVVPGWQTQVFMLRQPAADRGRDHVRISMNMSALDASVRNGRLFEPSGREQRMTELALLGLESGRQVATRAQLHDMLNDKSFDPLLAILAAHQLDGDADRALLREVVINLRRLVGADHPDVEALALRVPELAKGVVFPRPPMLTASWRLVISRSAVADGVVPAGSITEDISERLYGSGVWLWWSTEPAEDAPRPATNAIRPSTPSRPTSALHELIKRGAQQKAWGGGNSRYGLALQSILPRDALSDSAEIPQYEQRVIETMGVPRALVERAAEELLEETADQAPAQHMMVTPKARSMAKPKPMAKAKPVAPVRPAVKARRQAPAKAYAYAKPYAKAAPKAKVARKAAKKKGSR